MNGNASPIHTRKIKGVNTKTRTNQQSKMNDDNDSYEMSDAGLGFIGNKTVLFTQCCHICCGL